MHPHPVSILKAQRQGLRRRSNLLSERSVVLTVVRVQPRCGEEMMLVTISAMLVVRFSFRFSLHALAILRIWRGHWLYLRKLHSLCKISCGTHVHLAIVARVYTSFLESGCPPAQFIIRVMGIQLILLVYLSSHDLWGCVLPYWIG